MLSNRALFALTIAIACVVSTARADSEMYGSLDGSPGGTISAVETGAPAHKGRLRFVPLTLSGGSKVTVISPWRWTQIGDRLTASLEKSHRFFTKVFGDIPAFETSIRIMDSEAFYRRTGAPKWTNAMYFRGQIIIPLSASEPVDLENLYRSVRHEYTHAVVHALSGGKCPGWLDEGIAQWAEGSENPALQPALLEWLKNNKPVALSLLQGGFTKLDADVVPAAYAQSLFATNAMINTFGFKEIRQYFDHLRDGKTKTESFRKTFKQSEKAFEYRLGRTLRTWQKRHENVLLVNQ